MAVSEDELIAYAAASRPEDDDDACGGAIDLKMRVHFFSIPVAAPIYVTSTSASDVGEITLQGRTQSGNYIYGTLDLSGTGITAFYESNYAYLLKVTMADDAVGTVTLTAVDGDTETVLATIPPGERGFTSLFFKATADPLAESVRYEKFFWKNTNATDTFRGVLVCEDYDPEDVITHGVATAKDDSGSVANRLAAPASVTFSDINKNIPNTNLAAGEAIGIWLKQTLPAGRGQFFSTYISEIKGLVEE